MSNASVTLGIWTTTTLTMLNNDSLTNLTGEFSETEFYERFCPERTVVDKYITPLIYIIGFPGNILAFIIWMKRRMRHSSGYYLASLALVDFLFLALHVVFELQEVWGVNTLNVPVFCEVYTIVFLASQYLSPLLVLGFTVERYISICHPFKREHYCTTTRAKIVTVCLAGLCLALCGIQGYFWHFDTNYGVCTIRDVVAIGGTDSLWSIWTWVTETLLFLIVPLLVLLFNVLVIREAKRLSDFEHKQLRSRNQRSSATTIMLLAVSFYLIATTLPVTIVYVLYFSFPIGDLSLSYDEIAIDPVWQSHFSYVLIRKIIEEIGMTHFAGNFYIYLITGKAFRLEFQKVLPKGVCKHTDALWDSNGSNYNRAGAGKTTVSLMSNSGDGHDTCNGKGADETNI
jgi:hypothetical protein